MSDASDHIGTLMAFARGSKLPTPTNDAFMSALAAGLVTAKVHMTITKAGEGPVGRTWRLTAAGREMLLAHIASLPPDCRPCRRSTRSSVPAGAPRPNGVAAMRIDDVRDLRVLLHDAALCTRLSAWERGFVTGIGGKLAQEGDEIRLSDPQHGTLRRIAAKVYKT